MATGRVPASLTTAALGAREFTAGLGAVGVATPAAVDRASGAGARAAAATGVAGQVAGAGFALIATGAGGTTQVAE